MRQRIAVDLDGVLYNWDVTARYLLRAHGVRDMETPARHWYDLKERAGDEAWDWLWDEGVKRGLFRHGHLVRGAIDGIRQLRSLTDTISVVSHRPKTAVRDTLAFLSYHFGAEDPYPFSDIHILIDGSPKTDVKWDVLIDDKPKNITDALDAGRRAIIFDQLWNQGLECSLWLPPGSFGRAHSWSEVPTILEEMFK